MEWSRHPHRGALVETKAVDAVLAMAADPLDRWKPRPVLVTTPEGMGECRGMKMGYAPLLALLERRFDKGIDAWR